MTLSTGRNLGLLVNGALGEQHYAEFMRFLRGVDALVQPAVISRVANTPTAGMAEGDRYLLNSGQIARWTTFLSTGAWEYYTPREGWRLWSVADAKEYRYRANNWEEVTSGGGSGGMANPMTAVGDLIVGGTVTSGVAAAVRLAIGTVGQVLTVGADGKIVWAAPSSGGGGGSGDFKKDGTVAMTGPFNQAAPVSIASATNIDIVSATSDTLVITGTATIQTLGSGNPGMRRVLRFTGTPVLSHQVAWIDLPTGANVETEAGDIAEVMCVDGQSWKVISYTRKSGKALAASGSGSAFNGGKITTGLDEANILATDIAGLLSTNALAMSNNFLLVGNGSLSSMGTLTSGAKRTVMFDAQNTLTHSANFVLPGAANITTQKGDTAEFISRGSGAWTCISYTKADGTAVVGGAGGSFTGGTLTSALNEAPIQKLYSQNPVNLGATTSNVVRFAYWDAEVASFGTAPSGTRRTLIRDGDGGQDSGPVKLKHSSNLLLPGAADITMVIGDSATFVSLGAGVWFCEEFQRGSGMPLKNPTGPSTAMPDLASTSLVIFSASDTSDTFRVTGNTTINNIQSDGSVVPGTRRVLVFTDYLSLMNANGTIIMPGPNSYQLSLAESLVTAPGDVAVFVYLGSNIWRCLSYTRASGVPVANHAIINDVTSVSMNYGQSHSPSTYIRIDSESPASVGIGGWYTIPVGTEVVVEQAGAGAVTITQRYDEKLRRLATKSLQIAGQYGVARIRKVAHPNTWTVSGDLAQA